MPPILVMILYSFNQSHARLPQVTLQVARLHAPVVPGVERHPGPDSPRAEDVARSRSPRRSIAAILGTLLALALVRYRFRGKAADEHDHVHEHRRAGDRARARRCCRSSSRSACTAGFATLFIAHVMFCIAFVTITVRARLSGFDRSLEEAASATWGHPVDDVLQGHAAAHLAGGPGGGPAGVRAVDRRLRHLELRRTATTSTFPLWVYGAVKVGIPPQVFVFGTVIFMVGRHDRLDESRAAAQERLNRPPGPRRPLKEESPWPTQIDTERITMRAADIAALETRRLVERTPALGEAAPPGAAAACRTAWRPTSRREIRIRSTSNADRALTCGTWTGTSTWTATAASASTWSVTRTRRSWRPSTKAARGGTHFAVTTEKTVALAEQICRAVRAGAACGS